MDKAFEVNHQIDDEIQQHFKIFKSAAGRLNFTLSDNYGRHISTNHNKNIKELEQEIDKLKEDQVDFEMLKQNYKALQVRFENMQDDVSVERKMAKEKKRQQFQRRNDMNKVRKIDLEKYIPNSEEFVSMAKYSEISNKLIKERLKNEKLREEINNICHKNKYLTNSSNELLEIFENFLSATSATNPTQLKVHKTQISKILQTNPSHNHIIDSHFESLENYAHGYDVLKTCLETNALFSEKLEKYKNK